MAIPPQAVQDRRCNLHDWSSLRSELMFAFDQPISSGSTDAAGVRENDFSAWLVRSGSVHVRSDADECKAEAGQWLICYGKKIHQRFAPKTHILSMRILQSWPDGSPLFSGNTLHLLNAKKYPRLERLALPLLKMVETITLNESYEKDPRETFLWRTRLDYVSYIKYERQLLAWLAELAQSLLMEGSSMHVPGKIDPRLSKAFHLLDSVSPGQSFPEAGLCRATGLSIGRLNRLFVQAYGFTTLAYWEQRRIERARQVMNLPSIQIKEVASELGFVQLSHFSAWFKRHCGKSPRAYRQTLKPGNNL